GNRAGPDDMDGHAISLLGWGLNPQGRWDAIALHGDDPKRHHAGARCFAGNFLFSTGPNSQGGGKRTTKGHYDVPMRDCTVTLDDVSFDVNPGELHALVGENGAGKSTLVRILGGVHRPDHGEFAVDGRPCHFASPHDAIAAGIVTIPQELRLVPALSVAENIALGHLPVRRFGPLAMIDRARMSEEARAVLAELDFAPDPRSPVVLLGLAERQLVAI